MNSKIKILMATYNGESYLAEQIESIQSQLYENWELLILDDCSTDSTIDIVKEYMSKDKRISYRKNEYNIGQVATFDILLQDSKDEAYVMFCDQDDIWNEDKIVVTMQQMKIAESTNRCPILVYTDLDYVDTNLNPLHVNKVIVPQRDLRTLYSYNFAWGCTMLLNQELINQISSFAGLAENHDYWIHMVAMITGKVYYLDVPTLKYRQHSGNVTGGINNRSIWKKMSRLRQVYNNFSSGINQNKIISQMFYENDVSQAYYNIFNHTYFKRIYLAKKFGLKKSTNKENILFYMFLFLRRK
ncbi:MAG: glycosyltransferase family 2 protein [Culicoidibacterales bacterium]